MILNLLYILIGGGFIVTIMLLIVLFYRQGSIHVGSVKAGPIHDTHALPNGSYKTSISPFESFYHHGKKVNPKDYIVCKVEGDCMSPRGINACNLIFIEELKSAQQKESIKRGDIVYIKYTKGAYEGYKIREVDEKLDNNQIKTLYYTAEGKIKQSSALHELENIIGIVKMNFKN